LEAKGSGSDDARKECCVKPLHLKQNKPVATQPSLFGEVEIPVYAGTAVAAGAKLRAAREKLGLSIAAASKRLRLTHAQLVDLERGVYATSFEQAEEMLKRVTP
jgi:hypothetical protein